MKILFLRNRNPVQCRFESRARHHSCRGSPIGRGIRVHLKFVLARSKILNNRIRHIFW